MPKGARGLAFKAPELENLADIVEEIVPISHTDWDRVRDQHNEKFSKQNRTTESLRRKFQWMAKMKIPTGDPNMPRHIRVAKRAKATDGSTPVRDDDDDDDEEEDEEEVAEDDSQGDDSDEEDDVGGGDTGVGLVDPTNLFDSENKFGDDFDGGGGVATTATAAAATASTAASSVTTSVRGGKRSGAAIAGGGEKKKSSAFKQPLRIPRRSPSSSNASDDVEGGDGWSFRNMMHMMMMQNRMDNDRREQQNKADSEQREREYQLRREEMAIAREEAREQRQFMNLLFMSMLNKNEGTDNSNPMPPSPRPGKNA